MLPWFTDTLPKRMLALMIVALVGSHLLAFAVVHGVHEDPRGREGSVLRDLPTLSSLPPTPGLPDTAPRPPGKPPFGDERPPGPSDRDAGGEGPPRMPLDALLLDYGVRLAFMAAAAWLGSLWLARPMRRLAAASASLESGVASSGALPVLDERSGSIEVRQTAKVFNTMAAKLREQFHARGLLVAAISHDLRTPLTRIRLRLEAMRGDAEIRDRSIADIHELDTLIASVIEMFRLESQGHVGERVPTDVAALVRAVVDDMAEQGLPAACEADDAITLASPEALHRVVTNLVSNAIRYGGSAQVCVEAGPRDIRIIVDDPGPGIPGTELERVLQPFYRMEGSRDRNTGGTGLGLYIAREMTARQGGTLTLSNRPEGGLRAVVTLPR